MKSNKKIVVIGGGTGVFAVLSGLKSHFKDLSAIVTMADDGGSTGFLREEFGILPPGDIRRALIALASSDNKILSELFNYRFKKGSGLAGHNFGNLIITALEKITGSFDAAINEVSKILAIKGKVIPVTLKPTYLMAELENGSIVQGETNIDIPRHDGFLKIRKVWLRPAVPINPVARKAILEADAVIIGPGDLYTSLIPNLLVGGMKQAIQTANGKIIYFVNLMTKFGETTGFNSSDFLNATERYLGENVIDYVLINNKKPTSFRLKAYAAEKSEVVGVDLENFKSRAIPMTADLMRSRGLIRHDSEKVAKIIRMII